MSILPRSRPEVHSDPAAWPEWADDFIELCDHDEDGPPTAGERAWWSQHSGPPDGSPPAEPRLPMAEWVRVWASQIRYDGSNAAKWLAAEVDRLAALAAALDAETPDQFLGRREVLECGRSEDLVYAGYTRGYADGKSETMDLFGRG